jgi:hypothetical protein
LLVHVSGETAFDAPTKTNDEAPLTHSRTQVPLDTY